MAFKWINCKWSPNPKDYNNVRKEFICDTEDDISTLPECVPSSAAMVCSTGDIYIVNASRQWVKFSGSATSIPGGSSEGGSAIIDVTALPTENIKEDSFYRLLTGSMMHDQLVQNQMVCQCVDSFPETGEPAVSGDLSNLAKATITVYYNTQDGSVSAYVTDMLSGVFGVPAGWYPAAVLMSAVGYVFSGVITNIMDDPMDGTFRLLLEYVVYSYKDGWTALKPIGKAGTGKNAEVFNHPSNTATGYNSHAEGYSTTASGSCAHAEGDNTTASGDSSHAEGYRTTASESSHAEGCRTTASGYSSHAEGYDTTASGDESHAEGHSSHAEGDRSHAEGHSSHAEGDRSHAEGYTTTASGDNSHAEGDNTTASGNDSHAEGYTTTASGHRSHAEGFDTIASGNDSHAEGYDTTAEGDNSHAEGHKTTATRRSQHVQGEFNISDTEGTDKTARGKYAHIVGNGTGYNNRSNAHTLDWDGNAWFAGSVEGTALILKSPSGKRFKITVDDNGNLTATEATE